MTPQEFVNRWSNTVLSERQVAQSHFLDVCKLVGVEMPADGKTEEEEDFAFETSIKVRGGHGFADVFYQNHFAIEYKTADKYKDLNAAYDQLLRYRENLKNPPLLVVTDFNNWEIHTNFPNTEKRIYKFSHNEIATSSDAYAWLRAMFHAPERLHPGRNTEQVTREAAEAFQLIAENMRQWQAEPQRIAYFLTKLVFCLFAEDVGLLPRVSRESGQGIFTHIIQESRGRTSVFKQYLQNLFVAMNEGGEVLMRDIPYFNGTLFNVVTVEELRQEALDELAKAAKLNWEAIEPSIFGTLFERSLDPAKRSQLGAHYTSRDDILLIVEPVLMQPLRYHWETIQLQAALVRGRYDLAKNRRMETIARNQLLALRDDMLARIRLTKVLDPACGSGNFLYVALQMLMDLEKEVILHPLWAGLQMATREVHPRQMYGIEKDPIAHALASIVVWIGYIQWRINNGYGQEFGEPILEELEGNIVCKDAILPPATLLSPPDSNPPRSPHRHGGKQTRDETGRGEAVTRPQMEKVDWPKVDVIIGNPPFLGGQVMLGELGDEYLERLRRQYAGRVPAGADLVCYWFENARAQIANGGAKRAGLLATQAIRRGQNRVVLERIKDSGDIFVAWSNRNWSLDGAAVGVSKIGFDDGSQVEKMLDGVKVSNINADLTAMIDFTSVSTLAENKGIVFQGPVKVGGFDIPNEVAQRLLQARNRSGKSNAEVVKPFRNGNDLAKTLRGYWIIDFRDMVIESARQFEAPFAYVEENVKPFRQQNRNRRRREQWWQLGASGRNYRLGIAQVTRQVFTPRVAKHRLFVWANSAVFPDSRIYAYVRDDDYFFGILHSRTHEVWSLKLASRHGDGPDGGRPTYNNTTCFETYPFPWSPGREDESHPAHARISAAAKQLHEERQAWLHPSSASHSASHQDIGGTEGGSLKDRTLTNLYNALQVYRGESGMRVKPAAGDFAPRLDELHRELDEAACDAYGWDYAILADEEAILRALLALNLQRAAQSG